MAVLKNIADAIEELRKNFGTSSIYAASEEFLAPVESTTSGSLELDDAIGVGGWPNGRIIMLSGMESSGKSFLSLMKIREDIKKGGIALYIDAEYTLDPNWLDQLGIDRDRLLVTQNSSAKSVFELLLGKPKTSTRQNEIPGVLQNKKLLEAGLRTIVIDSVNALQPPMEIESEVGKSNMALMARFLPPELRKLTPLLDASGVTCFFIMQARENPNNPYGDSLTVSGGRALRHAASIWADCRKISGSDIKIKNQFNEEEVVGHKIRVKIRKNKVAPPFREAELTIRYVKGIDIRGELVSQGIKKGIIKKISEKKYEFEGEEFLGKNKLEEKVIEDANFARNLLAKIRGYREKEKERRLAQEWIEESNEESIDVSNLVKDTEEGVQDIEFDLPETNIPEIKKSSEMATIDNQEKENSDLTDTLEKLPDKVVNSSLTYTKEELENMSRSDLIELAKDLKITGVYSLTKKSDLVDAILKH